MIIDVFLNEKSKVQSTSQIIGKTNENNSTTLRFNFDESSDDLIKDSHFFLDFEKPNGTKTKSAEIKVEDKKAEFKIPNSLLDFPGIMKVEPILYKGDIVKKYSTLSFRIEESINATAAILESHPDFVSEFERIVEKLTFDGDGNKFLSDSGEYKEIEVKKDECVEHQWSEWKTIEGSANDTDCYAQERTCAKCGHKETNVVKHGDYYREVPTEGLLDYITCGKCKEHLVSVDKEKDYNGVYGVFEKSYTPSGPVTPPPPEEEECEHTWGAWKSVEGTQTSDRCYTQTRTCTSCQEVETVDVLHSGIYRSVPDTGVYDYIVCGNCNKRLASVSKLKAYSGKYGEFPASLVEDEPPVIVVPDE